MEQDVSLAYAWLWWATLEHFEISDREALFMTLVSGLANRKGFTYASKETLARYMRVSTTTVFALIKRLEKKGLLARVRRDGYVTSCLVVTNRWKTYVEMLEEKFGSRFSFFKK